jgi:hypothetical protein
VLTPVAGKLIVHVHNEAVKQGWLDQPCQLQRWSWFMTIKAAPLPRVPGGEFAGQDISRFQTPGNLEVPGLFHT